MTLRMPAPGPDARLAEPLAALSLVSDLSRGRPAEEAMRACLVATSLATSLGLSEAEVAATYYTALLRSVGCTATSHEYAVAFGGNDVRLRGRGDKIDATAPREALGLVWESTRGESLTGHVARFAAAARRAPTVVREGARADCEVGAQMARRFGLGRTIEQALLQVFDRWDGKGPGSGAATDRIASAARFAAVAYTFVMFLHDSGSDEAVETVRRRSGTSLDPTIATAILAHPADAIDVASQEDAWVSVLAAEPAPQKRIRDAELDDVARAFADAVDLKSPFFHGHSAGVARLARSAAEGIGLPSEDVVAVGRAGLLHDIGRAAVPTGIWEKPGPLSIADWEQVRLHPYHTERVLGRAPVLAPLARLAGAHHERTDASGYHRGSPASLQDVPSRILAAADVYQALTEERPHRTGVAADAAARTLETMPLDPEAVRVVIEAAGQTSRRPAQRVAGITDRELDVLRLLVRGQSEKDVARQLVISPSTVHTHVVHIYEKAGVSTRAGLAMFAMEHDFIRPERTTPAD